MAHKIHICSLNCQGLGVKEKRLRLYQWMKNKKCNIFYLQESHFTNSSTESLQHEFKGEMLHSYGNSQSRGVSIFIKDNLNCKLLDSFNDNDGRLLIVNVEIDDNLYTLVNIYAPNTPQNRNAFF